MSNKIFCSNCGNQLGINESNCECGFSMSQLEKKEINDKLATINSNVLIDNQLRVVTTLSNQDLLDNYKLDRLYVSSGMAKDDYEKKVNFLKLDLLPKINNWTDSIQEAEKKVAKDKVEVYGRVIAITDFVLKEFFGPFSVKENGLENFVEFRDFGKYKLSETIFEADLNFSDIKTVNFGSIGNDIMSSVGNTLSEGSFKELSKKSQWSDSDIKTVKTEVGIAVAGQLIAGVGNMIGQTQQAIKNVRVADKELNEKLKGISNVINALTIEEKEIEKQKRLYDKSDVILDTCYVKVLKPIVDELNADPIYLDYKVARKPFDNEQETIKIDNELLNTKIKISFWSCLLKTKNQNYISGWKKRIIQTGKVDRYKELINSLNIKAHKSLNDFKNFETQKTIEFEEFEKINRRTLKTIPAISKNAKDVIKFAGVLKQVKTNITN
ncbi:hypothetical protein [Winogradskyella helgolandensis]|uniref:hypothetical protein n=1 Tax=Winogradskyella helgolandensis TaxID=2697010 RepID=UPI0015BB86E4|nr:hypothetical protein [Winogradskyella helgolandensis]